MYLMEHSTGTRPYIMEWYDEVYLPTFGKLTEPNYTVRDGKTLTERMIGLDTKQLSDATFEIQNKVLSESQIRDTYLKPLFNENFINSYKSECDRRGYISFPLIKAKKIHDYTKKDESCINYNFSNLYVIDFTTYPSKRYLKCWIKGILEYEKNTRLQTKIISHKNKEFDIDELVEQYYPNPENYFNERDLPPYYSEREYPVRIALATGVTEQDQAAERNDNDGDDSDSSLHKTKPPPRPPAYT